MTPEQRAAKVVQRGCYATEAEVAEAIRAATEDIGRPPWRARWRYATRALVIGLTRRIWSAGMSLADSKLLTDYSFCPACGAWQRGPAPVNHRKPCWYHAGKKKEQGR